MVQHVISTALKIRLSLLTHRYAVPPLPQWGRGLHFIHSGLTVKCELITKCELTTALSRLRERGDREAVGEGLAGFAGKKQPLTPAAPYPRLLERAVINRRPPGNPNVQALSPRGPRGRGRCGSRGDLDGFRVPQDAWWTALTDQGAP